MLWCGHHTSCQCIHTHDEYMKMKLNDSINFQITTQHKWSTMHCSICTCNALVWSSYFVPMHLCTWWIHENDSQVQPSVLEKVRWMKRHLHQNKSFSLYDKWLIMTARTNFLLVVHYQTTISKRKSLLCEVLWIGPLTMVISPLPHSSNLPSGHRAYAEHLGNAEIATGASECLRMQEKPLEMPSPLQIARVIVMPSFARCHCH